MASCSSRRRHEEQLTFEDGRLKVAGREARAGFGFRGVAGERVGYASGDRLEEDAIRAAVATVQAVKGGHAGRENVAPGAPGPPLYGPGDPIEAADRGRKLAVLERIEAYCRAQEPAVVSVTATLAASHQAVEIFRGDGAHCTDLRPLVRLNVSVVVERDGRRESAGHGGGGRFGLDRLLEDGWWRGVADEALRQARLRLEAVPAPAGEMTVVLGAGWPGVMLHEAVGHGLEGDFNRKGTSAFAGLMGQRVAAPGVTVVDDGTHARAARLAHHRRRGHAHRPQRADRGRHPGRLHAGPPERPPDADGAHRQRPAPVLRPQRHAADDQHLHAGRQRSPATRSSPASSAASTPCRSAAARSTSPRAGSCSRRPRPT